MLLLSGAQKKFIATQRSLFTRGLVHIKALTGSCVELSGASKDSTPILPRLRGTLILPVRSRLTFDWGYNVTSKGFHGDMASTLPRDEQALSDLQLRHQSGDLNGDSTGNGRKAGRP